MKQQLVLEECEWKLTDETKTDKRLNPIDFDVLTVLQIIKDGKGSYDDGWFNIILKHGKNIRTSLQGELKAFGVNCDYTTVMRSINKLWSFGYIEYKRGFFNKTTNKGCWPKIRILKGTIEINDCQSDEYDDIEMTDDYNSFLTDCDTADYSDIAIAQEKEKEKEKDKENKKEIIKEKRKLKEYFENKSTDCTWGTFVSFNPSVYSLNIELDEVKDYFNSIKC